MFKKFLSFLLLVSLIFSVNTSVFANESQGITYKEFKKAQDDGYIGKEITYEEWNKIIELNNQFEKELENSDNFDKIYDSSEDDRETSLKSLPSLEKGDILITNGTSSFGVTGHAAIAISSDGILHSPGKKDSPVIKNNTREEFYKRYITNADHNNPWIKIYRPKNSDYGTNAADWAYNKYYNNNSVIYEINTNITGFDTIYCSKLVWQAYRYGANTKDVFNEVWNENYLDYFNYYDYSNGLRPIIPYELDEMIKSTYECKVI